MYNFGLDYQTFFIYTYHTGPNYRTMRLDVSQSLGKFVVKYVSTYTKGTLKKDQQRTYLKMFLCFFYSDFLYKAYVVGTHLNCINKLMQFKWQMGTHNICLYKEVDKNYTGCNLRTTALLDLHFMGACAVIRSNTVYNVSIKEETAAF